ncbi:MAG: cyclopropane-fatty-acyl-phospholipid synthase family protein, partial [Marinomonas sp.]
NKMYAKRPIWSRIGAKIVHRMNANTKKGSKDNISAHYDLGNDFFFLFLDPTMMYSSAIYPQQEASLEEAAVHKLDRICQKLQLTEADHLLEIGTGWGGMAIHAAKHYGCKVTTTTISKEQYEFAKERVEAEGLQDKITLLLKDYRDLEGQYDKLVSIEMIEAVGHEYYDSYFSKCSELLKPHGVMVIQAITIADQRYDYARRSVDFIQRYIFPGGCLPSNQVIAHKIASKTDMQIVGLEDITEHYAKTLADWRTRFHEARHHVLDMGFDDVFCRMWDFYLAYCEGGFKERAISTGQFVFAKPEHRLTIE